MIWNICFILSVIILIGSVFWARGWIFKPEEGPPPRPFYTIFAGVLIAVFVGMIPVFINILSEESGAGIKLILFDAIQTLQVFTGDAGYDPILDNITEAATGISKIYSTYMSCLFFAAPVLTFGFLVSLFKNVFTGVRYRIHYFGDVFIFSALTEKSLVLARSIRKKNSKAILVFTNVEEDEPDIDTKDLDAAKEIKALITPKDILSMKFGKHSSSAEMTFFLISEDKNTNLIKSLKIIDRYKNRKNTNLYVFSTGREDELFLSNANRGEIKVRRINSVRSLIYRFLYDEGDRLFERAVAGKDGQKEIHAVILGFDQRGKECLKALTWYGQMDGYSISIDAYDRDELAEDRFAALCPDLLSEEFNGKLIPGENRYSIRIHSGTEIGSKSFVESIRSLENCTFAFVSLGDDAENIKQATSLRVLCERAGWKPIIKAVLSDSEAREVLAGAKNYRGQAYEIEPIGDIESMYSQENLMGTELERLALERHLKWGKEEEFWQYEYNYRSSVATAIHMKARISCGIPGAGKKEEELTDTEKIILEKLEHRRWNAYMRSEGYIYSGSRDKASRNDLAKMHHDLVPFDQLSKEEKEIDRRVGSL